MSDVKSMIAKRVAQEIRDGDVINLGIGIPTLVSDYIPAGIKTYCESENGMLGIGGTPSYDKVDKDITDAGGAPATVKPGGCFFDSATSFGYIRGGHVQITVLGALQVDEEGNLANWIVPGKMFAGYGGAMDLVVGSEKVILAMEHTVKGDPKILKKCTLPLTGAKCVNLIITEKCVIEVTSKGLMLLEIAEGLTIEDVQSVTGATLLIPESGVKYMKLD